MQQTITISGVVIKTPKPNELEIDSYNITKSARVASGKMMSDFIAKKAKLQFNYAMISSIDRKTILDVINTNTIFFPVTYVEDNVILTKTVYVGDISGTLVRTGSIWYWVNFKFDLIEQ